MYVKKKSTTPIPTGTDQQGEVYPQLGSISLPGFGEDSNNPDNHSGAVQGEDTDHCAKEGSGDGMGRGGNEVEAPKTFESFKNYWESREKTCRVIG